MTEKQNFNALNLSTIPLDERDCIFEDKFILACNFDEENYLKDLANDPNMVPFLSAPYPFKIQFSMVQLCLNGRMRVRVNLDEYELHRNSLQIVTPGSIGECLEISDDYRTVFIALPNDYIITEENSEGALIVRKFLARQSLL